MTTTRRDLVKTLAATAAVASLPIDAHAFAPAVSDADLAEAERRIDKELECTLIATRRLGEAMKAMNEISGRLLSQARAEGLTVEPDMILGEIRPGQWIVRSPAEPHVCQIVDRGYACTCRRYGVFHRCEHAALVFEMGRVGELN